jgi:hypothetical protein
MSCAAEWTESSTACSAMLISERTRRILRSLPSTAPTQPSCGDHLPSQADEDLSVYRIRTPRRGDSLVHRAQARPYPVPPQCFPILVSPNSQAPGYGKIRTKTCLKLLRSDKRHKKNMYKSTDWCQKACPRRVYFVFNLETPDEDMSLECWGANAASVGGGGLLIKHRAEVFASRRAEGRVRMGRTQDRRG